MQDGYSQGWSLMLLLHGVLVAQLGILKGQRLPPPNGLFTHESGTWPGRHLAASPEGLSLSAACCGRQLRVQAPACVPVSRAGLHHLSWPRLRDHCHLMLLVPRKCQACRNLRRLPQVGGPLKVSGEGGVAAFGKYPQPHYTRSLCNKFQTISINHIDLYFSILGAALRDKDSCIRHAF